MSNMDILSKAASILAKYPLCDHCLGRLFASRGFGLDNAERGKAIKDLLLMQNYDASTGSINDAAVVEALARSGHKGALMLLRKLGRSVETAECAICGGLFRRLNVGEVVNNALAKIRELNVDFETIEVGVSVDKELMSREVKISLEFGLTSSESIKRELNRIIGRELVRALGKVHSTKPDIVVQVSTADWSVKVSQMPLYIEATYRKLIRGIGQVGPLSIESLASGALNRLGAGRVILHASGSESPKVRVLGGGRLSVIEASTPKTYRVAPGKFAANPPLAEFNVMGRVDKARVRYVKDSSRVRRLYRVLARLSQVVGEDQLKSLEEYFRNRQVRLGKKVKLVYSLKAVGFGEFVEFFIVAQGGLSIGGLFRGDTEPSIPGLLGVGVEVIEVDILGEAHA